MTRPAATTCLGRVAALGLVITAAAASARAEPWRVQEGVGAPSWLRLTLDHNARYEHLSHDFRRDAADTGLGMFLRTSVGIESTGRFAAGVEVLDARAYTTDATRLDTTHVNPLDVLQAYGALHERDVIDEGDHLDVRAGRITIDLGTRRVLARNRFRNTINAFTGIDATWTGRHKRVARAFVVMPVVRRPRDADALHANTRERDTENTDALLWGGHAAARAPNDSDAELYVLGLHERDGELASRNRQLVTVGVRWFRRPARGLHDFELELMGQAGTSRATTADEDVTDLRHRALSWHVEVGYSLPVAELRVVATHDFASGDRDPHDGAMNRFDLLFGARRFDFGPTGLFGAFARGNLQSPALRVTIAPTLRFEALAVYRLAWLASSTDAWTTADLRDPAGSAGRFIGEQGEVMLRYAPLPRNVILEAGAAYLRRGHFAKTAPDTRWANPAFVYAQLTVQL